MIFNMKWILLCSVVSSVMVVVSSFNKQDLLCTMHAGSCPKNTECRVQKICTTANDNCHLKPVCIDQGLATGHRHGCRVGMPVLEKREGVLVDATCYSSKPCPQGSFCNTMLQDTYSFCCPSDPDQPVKPGTCPVFGTRDPFPGCVDQCRNDGDCLWDEKCCQQGCELKCVPPVQEENCELTGCPENHYCHKKGSACKDPRACPPEGQCALCPPPSNCFCPNSVIKGKDGCLVCNCPPTWTFNRPSRPRWPWNRPPTPQQPRQRPNNNNWLTAALWHFFF